MSTKSVKSKSHFADINYASLRDQNHFRLMIFRYSLTTVFQKETIDNQFINLSKKKNSSNFTGDVLIYLQ